ncbi:biotin--[acetyl-CoA-carboxylase] ligase [Hyphococcus sp.]|uniref:biotin--[acetyl-CoA-carboxylase] ligase n=1 Tax=Hyphococcus sp. TaxID=2038636 RepID=UPI003CCB7ADD
MTRLASGADLQLFDTLDSTSLEAKRRIEAGENGPRWIVALTQTAGYGRRGRRWEQRTGDFAGTLFFKPEIDGEALGQVSFIVALALAAVLENHVPPEKISLKWPNDILTGGKKCAGVLLEKLSAHLAIGVGVNIVTAPADTPYQTARLLDYADTAPEPAPEPADFAAALDAHFWPLYEAWRARGFAPVREAWLARAAGLGREITVRLPNQTLTGVFDGLDASGALVLRSGGQKRTIAAGEVFFAPEEKK